jgi:hypothetical protein
MTRAIRAGAAACRSARYDDRSVRRENEPPHAHLVLGARDGPLCNLCLSPILANPLPSARHAPMELALRDYRRSSLSAMVILDERLPRVQRTPALGFY